MIFRRLRRKARGEYGINTGRSLVGAREVVVDVILSDSWRKHRCSEQFVNDLCDRVMNPALEELDRCFGGRSWGREIRSDLVLEGPGLAFQITVMKVEGWEITKMCVRINEVFNKHWELEIDRVPPK